MKSKPSTNENRIGLGLKWVLVGLKIGLAYLLVLGLAAFVAGFFLSAGSPADLALGLSLATYISFLLWLPLLFFILDRYSGRKFSVRSIFARLDLNKPTWRDIGWGLIIALATLQLIALLASAFDWLGLVDSGQRQSLFEFVPQSGWGLFWFFVPACLLAPIVEEIFFRRWIFKPLNGRFGLWPALVVSSVLFGLVHSDPAAPGVVIWGTGLGLALASVYHWSGNLWASIIMHGTINTLAVALHVLGY